MAGTVTRTIVKQFGDTTLNATYTFSYGDEYDTCDWDNYDPGDVGCPSNERTLDLSDDLSVWVEGPGTIHIDYYRMQGNSRNPWRSGDITSADGVLTWTAGRGPNPRTVSDLAGSECWRVD